MSRRKLLTVSLVGLVLAVAGGALAARWHTPTPPTAEPPAPLRVVLGVRPSGWHDAGEVPRGTRVEVPFVVSNPGPTAVTIGPIQTSCDCFRVELDATRVEAGTEVRGRAVIDLAKEPGFTGGLMLSAEAPAAEDGRPVFALKLSVEVK